ncbi:MAG: hypothetical protein Q8M03_10645 [Legionella sp.]|nr:hypothetical protein [Legionella sp.]
MPLSNEFIEEFSQLTQKYKGYTSRLSWKDTDFEPINDLLRACVDVISYEKDDELLCDEKYINELSKSAVLLKDSDPSFSNSCKEFLLNCIERKIIPDTIITKGIYIDPDSKKRPQLDLINSMDAIIHNMQKVHNVQLNAERIEKEQLRAENEALRNQLRHQALVHPQGECLEKAKAKLLELNEVMGLTVISHSALPLDNSPILDESLENNVSPVFMPNYPPPEPPVPGNHSDMPGIMQEIAGNSSPSLEGKPPSRPLPIPPPPVTQTPSSASRTSAARMALFSELTTKIQPRATRYANDEEKKSVPHQS